MANLNGKTCLVVDGSSLLGSAVAIALASAGARVAVAGEDPAAIATTVGAIQRGGNSAIQVPLDPLDPAKADAAVATVVERFGRLDVWCGPAAAPPAARTSLHLMPEAEWDATVDACITRAIVPAASALRTMKGQQHGSMIFIISVAAMVGLPLLTAFSGAEGVLVNLVRGLAREGAGAGIRVNAVCLGHGMDDLRVDGTPIGLSPEEIAPVIAFLASDESRHITGQLLAADDGLTAWRSA
ncbi:MAG: SDR family oxidoreductase [Chloroflexi bacterium]|nr:SDR family oxidoreductase [Chloroflexota bacterium]